MAFFDEIGRKITDGGQKAAEQARIFAEVSRLNSSLSEQERLINQLYLQIGKKYYEIHQTDPEEGVQAEVEKINVAQKQIEDIKAQIIVVKGAETCPKCGCEIAKGTVYCPQCGERIPELTSKMQDKDTMICNKCGNTVPKGQKFCIHCGNLLSTDEVNELKIICPGCGSEVQEGTKFCMKCGRMIED